MYLDEATKRVLKAAARRRGVPEAQIIREALTRYLSAAHLPPRPKPVGRSRDGGVAHRFDEALREAGFGQAPRR